MTLTLLLSKGLFQTASGSLGYPVRFDALCANLQFSNRTVFDTCPKALQIGQPTALSFVVGVAHVVTHQRTFATNITLFHRSNPIFVLFVFLKSGRKNNQ